MSDYEFWKDLGKIFNAVIAYQEKTIEFNKRFINPWIRIGNVFDQHDRQREEVRAHKQAAEIDPDNAQNWVNLGNAHYRNQSYDEAVNAFHKAIELNPKLGWPYSHLALIYAEQNKHVEAKALYEKSIQLLEDDREKAISWNRLGNLHRKLNEYELAIRAFQKADELDRENAGFKDVLGEKLAESGLQAGEPAQNNAIATSIQLIVEQSQSDEDAQNEKEIPAGVQAEAIGTTPAEELFIVSNQPKPASLAEVESNLTAGSAVPGGASALEVNDETVSQVEATHESYVEADATSSSMQAPAPTETIAAETLPHQVETYTAEMTLDRLVESKTFDSTPMLTVVQEIIATAPSAKENLLEVSVENRDVELVEPVAVVAAEESVAEIVEASNVVAEPAEPTAGVAAEESVVETAEVANLVEAVAELTEPVAVVVAKESVPEIAEVANPSDAIAKPTTRVATIAEEETVAEIAEIANLVEDVAEPDESIAAIAVEEPIAEITEVANLVEAVAEATNPVAFVVSEESAEGVAEVAQPSEVVVEAAEPMTFAVAEESTLEVAEVANPPEMGNVLHQPAYDEFLRDENQALASIAFQVSPTMPEQEIAAPHRKPMTLIDESGEFQLEMDAKNTHVWNELGNVYFNRGAVEDAIIAYSKAIELDRWFAWPYSNLALAYVQKGRFAEAMLLYQRSIELFTNEKDKAISWNRLGSVYRRLNDYDNAIAAYQRADELDPDNSTIYLQSRFSLLGSFQMDQNAHVNS